jgi:threonyl-tRNA synthetase
MRVRGFTQDDAHIFCTEDQVRDEVNACIRTLVEDLHVTRAVHRLNAVFTVLGRGGEHRIFVVVPVQEEAPGMVFWHNDGWTIFRELETFVRSKLKEYQ